jgi:hypothetical protein
MDDKAQQLREEVQRLRDAIAEASKGDNDSDWEARLLPHRRRLQHELEGALLLLAEVEETHRMKSAIQAAVESGFVESPIILRNMGECSLCMEEIPELQRWDDAPQFGRFWCCGAVCCGKCFVDADRHCQKALEGIVGDGKGGLPPIANEHELQSRVAELNRMNTCPFCRTYLKFSEEGYMQRLKFHAESKDWAQYEMADHCLRRSDIPQAIQWLKKPLLWGIPWPRDGWEKCVRIVALMPRPTDSCYPRLVVVMWRPSSFAPNMPKRPAVRRWRKPSRGACWRLDKGFRPRSA